MKHSDLWKEIESEASEIKDQGTLKRMIGENKLCPMFLGIQQPGMKRTFILQVPKDNMLLPESIASSKGFHFNVMIAGDETQEDYVSLILTVIKTDYNEIFEAISDDLYTKLNDLSGTKEIVSTFLNRVRLWQRFFEKQSAEGLSEDAQKGLYGELYFLNNFVLLNHSYEWFLRCWIGSEGRQQDFQFGHLSVEVKTTSAKQHQKLHVASEQQLDETNIKKLYLFYLSVSLVQNNKNTLPAIIKCIRSRLAVDPRSLDLFNSVLLTRGYLDAHETLYNHTGYSIRDSGFLSVRDDFPRIKESDLRQGVGDVRYTISVDVCAQYRISEKEFLKDLKEVAQ